MDGPRGIGGGQAPPGPHTSLAHGRFSRIHGRYQWTERRWNLTTAPWPVIIMIEQCYGGRKVRRWSFVCVRILFLGWSSYFCLCISAGALWPVKLWLASSICNDYASVGPKSSEHRATYLCQWINGLSLYSAAVPIASVLNLLESNLNLISDSLPSVFLHCWLYVRKSTNHPMCKYYRFSQPRVNLQWRLVPGY